MENLIIPYNEIPPPPKKNKQTYNDWPTKTFKKGFQTDRVNQKKEEMRNQVRTSFVDHSEVTLATSNFENFKITVKKGKLR